MITKADLVAARELKNHAQAYWESFSNTPTTFTEIESQVCYDVERRAALRSSVNADVAYNTLLDQYLQQESEGATL